ncbi:MAG: tetratricopeptide repeat protein [Bryobacteraceae bacterium]|jgi:thioredoxin-like negative regulator of GroEL
MTPRDFARLATGVVAAGLLIFPAYAQKPGGAGSVGTGAGAGTTTGTTGTRTPTTNPTNPTTGTPSNNTSPTITSPVFLSGHVAVDDGSPLPGPVTIERVCNGVTHTEGYTDTKGNFGIQLGNEQGVFQDATDGVGGGGMNGMSGTSGGHSGITSGANMGQSSQERLLSNCELRGRLGGYRSQSIILAGRRAMDDPDVGTLLLHRETAGEGSTISITTLQAPKDARKAFEKGLEYMKKSKYAEARTEFEKAVQIDQKFAAAWCELGKMQAGAEDFDMARGSFRMAIQSDAKFPVPYMELSRIAVEQKKWQEVSDLTATAIKLDAFDYPQAFLFNAAAHYNLRETDAAEKSVKEADRLDSRHQYPQIAHLYGLILAQKQDYTGAVTHLRDYLTQFPGASDAAAVRTELQKLDQVLAQK